MKKLLMWPAVGLLLGQALSVAADPPYQTDFPPEEFHALWQTVFEKIGDHAIAIVLGAPKQMVFCCRANPTSFTTSAGSRLDPQFRVPEERLYYRYEDVIVITADGYENFTDFLPTELDDLEKLVGQEGYSSHFRRSMINNRRPDRELNPFQTCAFLLERRFRRRAPRGDTYSRQPAVDVLHYVFRVTLNDQTDEIAGETTVEVRFLEKNVTDLSLDLTSCAGDKGMVVTAVTSAGLAARYQHKGDQLKIALDPAPKAGDHRIFTIGYRRVPGVGLRNGKNRHDLCC